MAAIELRNLQKLQLLGGKQVVFGSMIDPLASGANHIAKEETGLTHADVCFIQPIGSVAPPSEGSVRCNSVTSAGADGSSEGDVAIDVGLNVVEHFFLIIGDGPDPVTGTATQSA